MGACKLCGGAAAVGPVGYTSTSLTNCRAPECGPWFITHESARTLAVETVAPEVRKRISAKAHRDFDAGLGPLEVNEWCVAFWTEHKE
jgi:hypothetical protein